MFTRTLQANLENLLGEDYFPTAHNDNNVTPGAPTRARATVRVNFNEIQLRDAGEFYVAPAAE